VNDLTNIEVRSLFQQATSAYSNGDSVQAENLAQELIRLDPLHVDAHYLLGAIQLDHGDATNALPLLETAMRLAPDHPGIQYALGNAYYALDQWLEAIQCYERLRQIGHANNQVFLNLGIALHKDQQNDMAAQILEQGTRSYPSDAGLWNAYGEILNRQNNDLASIDAYERAVAIMPENPDYCANLALMYEQSNRMQDAESLASDMLKHHPQHPLLLLISIRCARRKKDYAKALSLLEKMPADTNLKFRRAGLFEAGRIHDYLKESAQAYECFLEGNKLTLELWPDHSRDAKNFIEDWKTIHAYLDTHERLSWPEFHADPQQPKQVFLLGFMRSGTTLMDTILETDPRITVLEEELPIHNVVNEVTKLPGGYPACLEQLTIQQVESLRCQYWDEVAALTGPLPGDIIVLDKQPLLAPHVGLAHILFPEARFIFALRHPCDVVMSSFMQPFGRNAFHANFTTLEQSAEVYSLVMDMWLAYQQQFDLEIHTLRYEALIHDKQQTLATVFDFLGLENAQIDIDHVSHAKERGRIYTPSYHQVVQPLYTDAMERWRRYRAYFDVALPILQPYIERFGYTC
jgi:tetratricopeptide (TPR) repeat protein